MSFTSEIKKLLKNQRLCIGLGVLLLLVVVVSRYNNRLGNTVSSMANNGQAADLSNDQYSGESAPAAPASPAVQPAMPAGMNSGPGSATGLRTVTSGVPSTCLNSQVANPSELLPRDSNTAFAAARPEGAGELANINLLKAGQLSGIDTVGGTLRNANLQLRSEPPNPQTQVSPWSNSTIEPDLMRVPLELGCGPQ